MSATVRSRGAAETVVIERETAARVMRILAFGVPPAALVAAGSTTATCASSPAPSRSG